MTRNKLEVIAEPGSPSFMTRRVVHAPRSLVFEAFTRPEHLKRWMGPSVLTMALCEVDLRVGGGYRFVFRDPSGKEMGFRGVFREIVRPERIVRTLIFESFPEAEALETLLLQEHEGRTTITTTTLHQSVEAREGHLGSGMEAGMVEGYARLDELLASLRGHGAAEAAL